MDEDKLSPGKSVIHPSHGLTTVSEITTRTIGGEERRYIVLERPEEHLVLHVPADQSEEVGLRAVIDEDEIAEVLSVLSEETEAGTMGWRKLRAKNEQRLQSGELVEVAQVLRDLTARDAEKGLTMTDRRIYDEARARLGNELREVLEDEDVEALIDQHLEN